ncbi:hypothetical protein [Geoalkalibacter halelectricus]|uniref:hypothetical protein n=1 Tax=Geoalkalibacter halelectricus TaxID=2847045 RepID=UPI003D24EC03
MAKKTIFAIALTAISFVVNPAISFSSGNVIVNQARNAGLDANLKTVESLSVFLTEGTVDFGAHSIWMTDANDSRMFTSIVEGVYSNRSMLNFMVVSPDKGSIIPDFTYLTIYYDNKSILEIRERDFPTWAYKGTVAQNVVTLEHNDLNIYLMPAGSGTIVIKREYGSGF